MFQTKKQLRKENQWLKDRLRRCNNLQTPDIHPCKDLNCYGCKHVVVPDDKLPIIILGCRIGAKCSNYAPNGLFNDNSKSADNEPA